MNAHAIQIRALNDSLRRNGVSGRVVVTPGIQALGTDTVHAIRNAVARFDAFDAANDPYGEHDFGALTVAGHSVLFKIDYHDLTLTGHSADPANAMITRRVLTIMLASEY